MNRIYFLIVDKMKRASYVFAYRDPDDDFQTLYIDHSIPEFTDIDMAKKFLLVLNRDAN